ncbi:hypothetical protein VTK26DRAFT_2443 [Humicola hyalothermophila]
MLCSRGAPCPCGWNKAANYVTFVADMNSSQVQTTNNRCGLGYTDIALPLMRVTTSTARTPMLQYQYSGPCQIGGTWQKVGVLTGWENERKLSGRRSERPESGRRWFNGRDGEVSTFRGTLTYRRIQLPKASTDKSSLRRLRRAATLGRTTTAIAALSVC